MRHQITTRTESTATAAPGSSVLIVDDDSSIRAVLSHRLKREGYQCAEACDGADALEHLEKRRYDLVLLDISMPKLDGFSVLHSIRSKFSEAELPVIMVTAEDEKEEIIRAFNGGANDYLTKPIDLDLAFARIETQIRLHQCQAELQASEERYALSAQGSNDGLWDWRIDEDRIHYSERWTSLLGIEGSPLTNSTAVWFQRIHPEDAPRVQCELESHLQGNQAHYESQMRMRHENGNYRWMLCRGIAVRNQLGRTIRMAGSLTDITESKVADSLTGLPNRLMFRDRLEQTAERRKETSCGNYAVFYLDLDNFKLVNDSLGHDAGDQLLVAVARRLEGCLRSTDAIIARMGGDEFTILVDHIASKEVAQKLAERIAESFEAPFAIGKRREIFTSVSVGISYADIETNVDDLIRGADTAMYQAKAEGCPFRFYNPRMQQAKKARFDIENELHQAIERNEIFLHYQPIVEIDTGKLSSVEALVRWNHPRLGTVGPLQFVAIAEETGMVIPIGRSILQMACQQLASWRSRFLACQDLRIGVNVSTKQFAGSSLVGDVMDALSDSGLNPDALTIEITESMVMENPSEAAERLQELRSRGVRIAIDDFGTGYSSLASLHQLSLDVLKVDQSFVSNMVRSCENNAIVRTILTLADNLRLDVVAEGIETHDQRESLRSMGCKYGQGYLFSKPLSVDDVEQLFEADVIPRLEPEALTILV